MKKTLSALLSIVMAFSILMGLSVPVYADGVYGDGEYSYRVLDNGTAEIVSFSGYSENVIIPERVGKYTVTGIGTQAFGNKNNQKYLKNVTIPGCVSYIGEYAFYDCYNLKTVNMLYGVKNIGFRAFNKCNYLKDVTIPDSVTSIGSQAFSDCTSLTDIVLPDSVTEIGESIFCRCSNLKSVKLSNSITTVSRNAFSSCVNLTSVTGLEKVKHIDVQAFYNCKILRNIFLPAGITNIDYNAFYMCDNLANVYFCGNESAWNNILIEAGNECLTQANIHFHKWNEGTVTKTPTCDENGVKTYTCTVCGETKTEVIAKTGHTYKNAVTKATLSKNGKIVSKCSVCGDIAKTTTIYYPKTVKLSANNYTYNGKAQKPAAVVKDSTGKALTLNKDYTVTYSNTSSKNVGKYIVTIHFKGNYSGSKTIGYCINPKGTQFLTSSQGGFKAIKNGFTLKWNKQATQVTGYQIQYATRSDFANAASVSVVGANNTTKTIKGRAGGTRYYVRIRTFTKKDGKTFFSSWNSGTKSVVTLK